MIWSRVVTCSRPAARSWNLPPSQSRTATRPWHCGPRHRLSFNVLIGCRLVWSHVRTRHSFVLYYDTDLAVIRCTTLEYPPRGHSGTGACHFSVAGDNYPTTSIRFYSLRQAFARRHPHSYARCYDSSVLSFFAR
jgi:hypothetical protein